ncbi:Rhodanese [Micractinium conductrix]|uniref:Rhodanese n=1 Tax=Micractinium conductrix TaxID=554055 RepID=A0A2P6VCS9_9CHLO|nr:Rhodanese [Micractinium conductrix]|eukprot:PSC71887.1 Rhodanese [Micractinium conductrix]
MYAPAVTKVSPVQVKALLRGEERGKVLVVDVRDSDFSGGHIKGAINVVASQFYDDATVEKFIARFCRDVETVVFHCYLSQQRGPFCAQRLAERLEAQGCSQPEVCVMAGGWKRFRRELEEADLALVEDFMH